MLHYRRNDASDSRMCSCHDVGGITRVKRTEMKCNLLLNRSKRILLRRLEYFANSDSLINLVTRKSYHLFRNSGNRIFVDVQIFLDFCRYPFREADTMNI